MEREVSRDDVEVAYSRSGGPGGQNVNKVGAFVGPLNGRTCWREPTTRGGMPFLAHAQLNTKCDLRLHLASCTFLSEEVRRSG